MGKLQEFDITFANNKVVYSPGESISGTVKIRTGNSLQYKAIKVNCQGSCGVSNKMNDASWALEEQYCNSTLSVADKGTLPAGEHSFPFQFLIPASVPTSFEGPFGKIVYRVRAVIDTPRFSKDYKAQRPFYLLNLLNLNEVPNIEQPSYAVTTKKFSYLLVKTGTLMLKARSDLRGYTPGQVIKLATEIHNKSGKDTGCVLASLIQKVTYKTKRPVYDLRAIAEVEGAGVKAGKHAEWREQIIVPPLPQSALAGCSLIEIDYFIQCLLMAVAGVTKISRSSCHSAHLHREHCCELVSVEAHGLQSRSVWRVHNHRPEPRRGDTQRPASRGGPGGGDVCRGPGQRGDPHKESLSAGSVGPAALHVPECVQPRPRCGLPSQPQTARCQ
ncbi:arrestin domain-containing protein 1b isoform X2 [Centroberyx gerrardi]